MKKAIFCVLLSGAMTVALTGCESMAAGPDCVVGTSDTGLTNAGDSRLGQRNCVPVQTQAAAPKS